MRKSVDRNKIKLLGKRIAYMRKSKKLSQEELSDKAELTLSQIARIETGVINTSVNTLFILADALEIRVSEFFEETDYTLKPNPEI